MDLVAFFKKKFCQVGAVLTSDACYKGFLADFLLCNSAHCTGLNYSKVKQDF